MLSFQASFFVHN